MLRTMGMLLLALLLQGGTLAVSAQPFKATLQTGRVVLKDTQGNIRWQKPVPDAFRVLVSPDRVVVFSRDARSGTHTVQAFDLKGNPVWHRTHTFGHGGEWFYRSHLMLRLVGGDAKSWMGILRLRDGKGFLPISGSVLRTEGNLILLFSEHKMNRLCWRILENVSSLLRSTDS